MKKCVPLTTALVALHGFVFLLPAADYKPGRAGFDFPIYTNQPPGRQITSGQLPATTRALSPEETRKLIEVPPGFEVRLFASEPMIVNPVAMTWDERGRLWAVELYDYPKGAPKGEKGRDRIKILEDTDADGVADKVTVFADGFSLATGLALGNGGVYVGAAPNFYFLRDTNNDDKADTQEVLLTGFGMEDRHELLNGFAWGPDGWLYMTHGVFTHSKVRPPGADPTGHDPDGFGVQMDAALARYHPVTKKFEVFADGTSNPWGVDWNERGDAFVSACVIHHLFHLAPGGLYNRQGGTWPNPYGYVQDLPSKGLPAIVDWRHHRAAHSGICVYQGDQYPPEWRGLVFLGNIHASALNCDRLTPVGATYKAERESTLLASAGAELHKKEDHAIAKGEDWKHLGPGNFFVSRDPWVRPVSVQTGPDGCMWVMDWYDKYPCYQNAQADPEGVDREYGRIWRVVWVGNQRGKPVPSRPSQEMDLKRLSTDELAGLLTHQNNWQRRQAQRLVTERRDPALVRTLHGGSKIKELVTRNIRPEVRLAALWTLHSAGALEEAVLEETVKDTNAAVRAWSARLIGERGYPFGFSIKALAKLARDEDDSVRAAVAVAARQFNSRSLTVDTPPPIPLHEVVMGGVLSDLHKSPFNPNDPLLPFLYWMAVEPIVAFDASHALGFYENAKDDNLPDWPMNNYIIQRIMRRVCDLPESTLRDKHMNKAFEVLGHLADQPQLANAALDGLIEGFKGKPTRPTIDLEPVFAKLAANPAVAAKAQRLAATLGDKSAARLLMAKINEPKASFDERLKGITAARDAKGEAARDELLKFIRSPLGEMSSASSQLKSEAVRAIIALGYDNAYAVVDAWPQLPPMTRIAAAEVLGGGTKTARALLAGVEKKTVSPSDISATARRALATSSDTTIADNADKLLGKYRKPGADKLKLIAEKRGLVLRGTPDLNNGHEVARKTCFVCHKMYGEGADVGPDLTGVGRSTLDALLHNVIDPNEVIGNGFETVEVEVKDGTTYTGRLVEESGTRLKLVNAGPVEYVVAKSDIAAADGKPKVTKKELSLMPEGLEQIPDKDFRDLIMFILNPPGDQRPWTPALRRELIGDDGAIQQAAGAK